ncbi:CopG family ribbon-helix-helix protein [Desulfovibrio sp. TomC]|uniref:CopG family ribbon-helix-helix protein n=1 Tax=Desulfovibrio sp. TomC TaxID=1562888 RepID=UPI00064CFCC9|nr:CopG family ribbon-helix-helix protein [Desulfovibrio sp. TomC]
MNTSMSLRLSEELSNKINEIAIATGRTKSFVAVQALQDFVEREAWQVSEIRKSLAEADVGDFATDEEMKALDEKWGKRDR